MLTVLYIQFTSVYTVYLLAYSCTLIMASATFDMDSYIMGYHEYRTKWMPMLNEVLETKRESNNPMDKYAVATVKMMKQLGIS